MSTEFCGHDSVVDDETCNVECKYLDDAANITARHNDPGSATTSSGKCLA
jgi:hypothetical protein